MTEDAAKFESRALASTAMHAETRYSFTAQFIVGSALLTKRATAIEQIEVPSDQQKAEHMALVVSAVMQATAAIESALAEVLQHGPGHHLGSNGNDLSALSLLEPRKTEIDEAKGVLERWDLVLQALGKPKLKRGAQPWGDAKLLVGLRNALVHYRSHWNGAVTPTTLLGGLRPKRFTPPPFVSVYSNEFPHRLLGVACATWAYQTAAKAIDDAYSRLGFPSVLAGYREPGGNLHGLLP